MVVHMMPIKYQNKPYQKTKRQMDKTIEEHAEERAIGYANTFNRLTPIDFKHGIEKGFIKGYLDAMYESGAAQEIEQKTLEIKKLREALEASHKVIEIQAKQAALSKDKET